MVVIVDRELKEPLTWLVIQIRGALATVGLTGFEPATP